MLRYAVFCFVMLASVHGLADLSKEEMEALKALVTAPVAKCMDKFKEDKKSEENEMKLAGCTFQETKIIDSKGMFSPEAGLAFIKQAVKDETLIEEFKKFGDYCTKVNDENVSDGDKGIERGMLLAKCMQEFLKQYKKDE